MEFLFRWYPVGELASRWRDPPLCAASAAGRLSQRLLECPLDILA